METTDAVRLLLATNLRRARAELGLTLSELSRRSSIGKATLSALEAGSGNPTIETVFSLSRALELPISALLETPPVGELAVVRAEEQDVLSGEAVDLRMLRRVESDELIIEMYDQQVRPGGSQRSGGHVGTEHTIVQVGRLRVEVAGSVAELGPGDAVAFEAGQPHTYTAVEGMVRSVLVLQYRTERDEVGHPHLR